MKQKTAIEAQDFVLLLLFCGSETGIHPKGYKLRIQQSKQTKKLQ